MGECGVLFPRGSGALHWWKATHVEGMLRYLLPLCMPEQRVVVNFTDYSPNSKYVRPVGVSDLRNVHLAAAGYTLVPVSYAAMLAAGKDTSARAAFLVEAMAQLLQAPEGQV